MGHFLEGVFESESNDVLGIRTTVGESFGEFFFVGRHDEEVDEGGLNGGVFARADEVGALHVDIHDDVFSLVDEVEDFRFQGAIVVSMDFGMF